MSNREPVDSIPAGFDAQAGRYAVNGNTTENDERVGYHLNLGRRDNSSARGDYTLYSSGDNLHYERWQSDVVEANVTTAEGSISYQSHRQEGTGYLVVSVTRNFENYTMVLDGQRLVSATHRNGIETNDIDVNDQRAVFIAQSFIRQGAGAVAEDPQYQAMQAVAARQGVVSFGPNDGRVDPEEAFEHGIRVDHSANRGRNERS